MASSLRSRLVAALSTPEPNVTSAGPAVFEKQATLSPSQANAVQILALTIACVGMVPVLFGFYCFARMKKAFHHFLILMLITGDSIKLLWYLIMPIVSFAQGPVRSTDNVCQVSGFFIAFGTEMSDFAVLLIALHNALYVFRPPRGLGEGGLYKYRHTCVVLWFVLPVLMASLAFINTGPAYVTFGPFCYLPKDPIWYRLGLTWIPRFTIFIVIISCYLAIYIYVGVRFRSFGRLGSTSSQPLRGPKERPYGFRRFFQSAKRIISTMNGGQNAALPPLSARGASSNQRPGSSGQQAEWEAVGFITSASLMATSSGGVIEYPIPRPSLDQTEDGTGEGSVAVHPPAHHDVFHSHRALFHQPGNSIHSTMDTTKADTKGSLTSRGSYSSYTPDQLILTRIAIQRQLRFLFLYPVIYIVMWTPGFASNCLQWAGWFNHHVGFWLSCLNVVFIYLQSPVDCLIFSWRERPWHLIDGPEARWAEALKRWFRGSSKRVSTPPSVEEKRGSRNHGEVYWWDELRKNSVV